MTDLQLKLREIESTADLLEKSLKLAGLVTHVFSQAGWSLAVVGGSAVEFYTEGAYMSGDIDFCRCSPDPIPLRKAQDLMAKLGATGGPRSWKVAGLFIDLLGFLENEAKTPLRTIQTPYGAISLIPAELALVERVMLAYYPQPDADALDIARKFMAVCLSGGTPVNWDEVARLSALASFDVSRELEKLKREITGEKA
jgi:hypothetical protein